MKTICIIPARGGSKGVPGKNIIEICGKPLIQYSIEAALESKLITEIWVSSDNSKTLEIANGFKGIITHNRPAHLSTDISPISDTIFAILNGTNIKFDTFVLLQPTSPIRSGKQIDEAIEMLYSNPKVNSVISVCAMNDIHPARMYWNEKDGLIPLHSEYEYMRRQDIPSVYFRNGSIYVTRIVAFLKIRQVMVKPSLGYVMPTSHLLNIDEERDLLIAESLLSAWKKGLL